MLSKGKKICAATGGGGSALDYLEDLRAEGGRVEDYFASRAVGQWFNPTGLFGLRGAVKRGEFTHIFAGRHPHTGRALGPTVDLDRMGGMEFSCSPPKDLSILWSAGNEDQRRVLQSAHDLSVDRLMRFLQDRAARSRTGAGGQGGLARASLIAAIFRHETSREADPQLHTHIAVANLAILDNGKLRTLEFKRFLEFRGAASAMYRVALAEELGRLKVRIERDGRNFVLPDVPRALVSEQSQRRRLMDVFHANLMAYLRAEAEARSPVVSERFGTAIRKFLSEWRANGKPPLRWRELTLDGEEDRVGYADAVASATRGNKPRMSRDELESEWAAKRVTYGFSIDQVLSKTAARQPSTVAKRADIVRSAVTELSEKCAVLEERDVIRIVAEHAQGMLTYDDVELALREAVANKDLITLSDGKDERLYTTAKIVEREGRIVSCVQRRAYENEHEISGGHYKAVVASRSTMTDEQKENLAYAAQGRGVGVIEGGAGTGKRSTIDVVRDMHERAGYEVLGCAFSRKAAEALENSSSIASSTVCELLAEVRKEGRRLGRKTCIVVDDAGLVSSAHGEALLLSAEGGRSKVLLVGDTHQLLPIVAGAVTGHARGHTDPAVGQAVLRQELDETDPDPAWRRKSVADLMMGQVQYAIRALASRGRIQVADDLTRARQRIVDRFRELVHTKESFAVLARRNHDVTLLNVSLREASRAAGMLAAEEIEIDGAEGKLALAVGDRVMMRKSDVGHMLVNGAIGVVNEIRVLPTEQKPRSNFAVTLRMEDGSLRVIDTRTYRDKRGKVALSHAYAMTVHSSHGVTVDRALVFADASWNRRDAYLGLSRHRIDVEIFTARPIWKKKVREVHAEHAGEISDTQLHTMMESIWSRNLKRAHLFDYLGHERTREIVAERQRRAAEPDLMEPGATENVAELSFADLMPPLPPLRVEPEVEEKLRQIVYGAVVAPPALTRSVEAEARTIEPEYSAGR